MMTYMYGREAGDAIRAYWATRISAPPAEGSKDPRDDMRWSGSLAKLSDGALEHASLMAAGADPRWGGLRDEIESERDRRLKAARLAEVCANGFYEMHEAPSEIGT